MKLGLLYFAIYQHLILLALIVSTVPRHKDSTTSLALSTDASITEESESTSVLSTISQEPEAPRRGLWRKVVQLIVPDAQARLDEYEASMYGRIARKEIDSRHGRQGNETEV